MTKTEALSYFGDPATDQAGCVTAMASALGISRTAIYMWEEAEIPELRALQIEKIDALRRAPPPTDDQVAAVR